jgi:hypothetical protein
MLPTAAMTAAATIAILQTAAMTTAATIAVLAMTTVTTQGCHLCRGNCAPQIR